MKSKKDIFYIFFTVVFYIASVAIIAWIDRQEVDKEVDKRANEICQKISSADKKTDKKLPAGDVPKDANSPIISKKEASESLKNIDVLVNSVGEINLPN